MNSIETSDLESKLLQIKTWQKLIILDYEIDNIKEG